MLILSILLAMAPPGAVAIKSDNYGPIAKAAQSAQVIQLGEATHGGAEFYATKTAIVKYLHEKAGYNVLVLESGAIETTLAMEARSARTPEQLMEDTVFANFRWQESLPLFAYIKANPKLKVIGVDVQFSADAVVQLTVDAIKPHDPELAAEINQRIGEGYQFMGQSAEPEKFNKARDTFVAWLDSAQMRLNAIRDKSPQVKLIAECWPGLRKFWSASANQVRTGRQSVWRDEIMAQNFVRMVGNQKAIFWAHNGHIGKGLGYKIVGDFLRETYEDKTYALGLFAQKGEWYAHWDRKTYPYAAPQGGLENLFPADGKTWFLDLKEHPTALPKMVQAYEPENGGVLSFAPASRFDGVIVLPKSSIPTRVTKK